MSKNEITTAKVVTMPSPAESVHPGTMITALKTHDNLDIDKLTALFELQKKYDDEIARKAYHVAKSQFAAIAPTIIADGEADFTAGNKRTNYKYATLAGTLSQIRDALEQCRLHVGWKTEEVENRLKVTCFLTHDLGYQEETSLSAGREDGKGQSGMNSLQALKSTTSYLERITLYALLGLASTDDDDDGRAAVKPEIVKLNPDQVNEIHAMITDNDLDMKGFMKWLALSGARAGLIEDIPVDCFDAVVRKIKATIKAKQDAKE